MDLIMCPECSRQVPVRDAVCQNCGSPIKQANELMTLYPDTVRCKGCNFVYPIKLYLCPSCKAINDQKPNINTKDQSQAAIARQQKLIKQVARQQKLVKQAEERPKKSSIEEHIKNSNLLAVKKSENNLHELIEVQQDYALRQQFKACQTQEAKPIEITSANYQQEPSTYIQNDTGVICPKCKARNAYHTRNKGFGLGKAAVGALLLGPVGLLGGLIGSKKLVVQCISCGNKWTR